MEQQVGGLEICVDDSVGMQSLEAGEDLTGQRPELRLVSDLLQVLLEPLLQVPSIIDVLQEENDLVFAFGILEYLDNAWVVKMALDGAFVASLLQLALAKQLGLVYLLLYDQL